MFLIVIVIVMLGHYIWLAVLYGVAGAYSGRNPGSAEALRPRLPDRRGHHVQRGHPGCGSGVRRQEQEPAQGHGELRHPLFANIHLCGSVLTEVFFVMTVSQVLYGHLPAVGTMVLFCILLGIFAIGAPGVPGGTVMASLGLITGVLGFGEDGTALMLAVFALQDSFGTACNVTGDGA